MSVAFDVFKQIIEESFPLNCAYGWDNSGVQLKTSDSISSVLIALDLTLDVVSEAEQKGCDLILTHHPAIFRAVKTLSFDDPVTGAIVKAANAGISIYSAHTSCDCAPDGLNCEIARALKLKDPEIFAVDGCENPLGGLGVKGLFDKVMSDSEIIELTKSVFGIKAVRCSNVKGSFDKVAVIGGSAGEFYKEALDQNINVLITGEAKHNEFVEAYACGILLIAAGHYETEKFFMQLALRKLKESIIEKGITLDVQIAQNEVQTSFVQ